MDSIAKTWLPEVHKYCPDVPFIVVGIADTTSEDAAKDSVTKGNENNNENESSSSTENAASPACTNGPAVARRLGAACYLECDLGCRDSVDAVFLQAVRSSAVFGGMASRKDSSCTLQ